MNTRKKIGSTFWVIITLIAILGLIWSFISPTDFNKWQGISRNLINKFRYFGPFVFILIQALQVIITPISHYIVGAIGGFLYGFFWGGILNYIGRVIGHITAFFLARKFGRKILEKYVKEDVIEKYDAILSGENKDEKVTIQSLILFLIYFLPFFPDDEISYLVGASKMSTKLFILANLFGHLGGSFSLALIGNGISTRDPWFWILTIVTLIGFPIIWFMLRLSVKKKSNESH